MLSRKEKNNENIIHENEIYNTDNIITAQKCPTAGLGPPYKDLDD